MTWHAATVTPAQLAAELATIRETGGTVTSSRPEADGVHLVWTTAG